jgi:uncharacterized membrane protein YphA (DoxX/SURF4 family)
MLNVLVYGCSFDYSFKSKIGLMRDTVTAVIGGAGIGASTAVEHVANLNPTDLQSVLATVVQVIIGIATIIGLFRKKKKVA